MPDRDLVRIEHPDYPGNVRQVSREAYERRSRRLGWRLVDDEPAIAVVADLGDYSGEREVLVAEARALGLNPHHRAKAETIRRQIEEAEARDAERLGTDSE
jgi:hypothetical protein